MGDLKEHLTNGQNFMEISLFINYTLYFFERLGHPIDMLNAKEVPPGHLADFCSLTLANFILLLLMSFRFQLLMTVFKPVAILNTLFEVTFVEMAPIFGFFMCWNYFYAMCYQLLRVEVEKVGKDEETDYPNTGTDFRFFMRSFRNSIGDIAAPVYSFWNEQIKKYNETDHSSELAGPADPSSKLARGEPPGFINANTIVYLIWFCWFLAQVSQVIIVLNLVIAVLSQAYDKVISESAKQLYIGRSKKNFGYLRRK